MQSVSQGRLSLDPSSVAARTLTRTLGGSERAWRAPPENPALSPDEVHVWRARLDRSAAQMGDLCGVLSTDERDRANQFRFQGDRDRFTVARGLLRAILSLYLGVAPAQVRFCYGAYGKPRLAPPLDGSGLCFNVSHSSGLVLCAVAIDRRVAIDLEWLGTCFAYEPIAERCFSPRERAMLASLPAEGTGRQAFFNCWTRKEALVKAMGGGLSIPLDQFTVSLVPGEPAVLLEISGDRGERSGWSLRELFPGAGFVGALAVEGYGWRLSCWECPEWIPTRYVSVEKGMGAS